MYIRHINLEPLAPSEKYRALKLPNIGDKTSQSIKEATKNRIHKHLLDNIQHT